LCDDVLIFLEKRKALLNGNAGLLIEFIQLREVDGAPGFERDGFLQFRDGPVKIASYQALISEFT
jgi:hypothetical protein